MIGLESIISGTDEDISVDCLRTALGPGDSDLLGGVDAPFLKLYIVLVLGYVLKLPLFLGGLAYLLAESLSLGVA